MKTLVWIISLVGCLGAVLALGADPNANSKLLLVGGGPIPQSAVRQFCSWAGNSTGRVLVIPWASRQEPHDNYLEFLGHFSACRGIQTEEAPGPILNSRQIDELFKSLNRATAVFFTGGSQYRLITSIRSIPGLEAKLRELYGRGVPMGGSSAGTAFMSKVMLTGDGDETVIDANAIETSSGLGLIENATLDTHFLKRQRQNRLFSVLQARPDLLGIGIDEGSAVLITGNAQMTAAVGSGPIMVFDASPGAGTWKITLLNEGERFDLNSRSK